MSKDLPQAARQSPWRTWYTLRLLRWCGRIIWHRRTGWSLACVISLIVLYYQFENWRSARELASMRLKLIAYAGTEDPARVRPASIPDARNFFALPVIEQWATLPLSRDSRFKAYHIPVDAFLPKTFIRPELTPNGDGTDRIDFEAWAAQCQAAGKNLPPGEPPAVTMDRELADGRGLLPSLASGLHRPFSCFKPGLSEAAHEEDNGLFRDEIPHLVGLNKAFSDLGLHLRAAAHAGNAAKAQPTAMIMLRLFPEAAATHGSLISSLISIGSHGIAFDALHDALSQPVWDADGLRQLQYQLARINDTEVLHAALINEMLGTFSQLLRMREMRLHGAADKILDVFGAAPQNRGWGRKTESAVLRSWLSYGPTGWYDANIAAYLEGMMEFIGPATETAWVDGSHRSEQVKIRAAFMYGVNPRSWISGIATPNFGNVFEAAARTLFRRRCLIIACELERYRLEHGAFPDSLQAVQGALDGFHTTDPALPGHSLGYRPEKQGYLLWSIGYNARAGGSGWDSNWQWRMNAPQK